MVRNRTRRRLLVGTGTLATGVLAGCLGGDSTENDGNGGNGTENGSSGWPSYGYDVRNTGYHPTTTGPKDGVEQAWSTDIDGEVDAPPVIADGTAFWVGSTDDGGIVYATDTDDGTIEWETTTESGFVKPAAVVDGTVYAENGVQVFAFDAATGDQQWAADVQPSTTPLVHDGSVYVLGVDERSVAVTDYFIYEIDADTGEYEALKEYSRDEEEGGAYGKDFSDSFAAVGDTLVFNNFYEVRALDLEAGEEKWVYEGEDVEKLHERDPVIADGTVYAASSYSSDTGAPLLAIDLETGEEQWRYNDSEFTGRLGELSVTDETVYAPYYGSLYAINAENGEKRWSTEITEDFRSFKDGKALIADDVLYANTEETLWGIDAATGDALWEHTLAGGATVESGSVVVHDGMLYVSTEAGSYSLNALEDT